LAHGQLISGTAIVLIGRLADVFDGMVADYTKTKSPLGEGIDATVDKILLTAALYILIDKSLLPLVVGIVMAVHAVYVTTVSTVGRSWKVNLHPSLTGKLAAVFEWACVGFYLLADIIKGQLHNPGLANAAALLCFGVFIVAAVWSSLNYTRTMYYKRTMNDGH
jgi:phosphatidylglycerophosphate synthase